VRIFLDSSALAKRYVEERGCQQVDDLCQEASLLAVSVLCVPEIVSALNRRMMEKVLSHEQYVHAQRHLLLDIEDSVILELTVPVIAATVAVLERNALRAMDALHVACAELWEAELFVSADTRQIAAAKKAGLWTRRV